MYIVKDKLQLMGFNIITNEYDSQTIKAVYKDLIQVEIKDLTHNYYNLTYSMIVKNPQLGPLEKSYLKYLTLRCIQFASKIELLEYLDNNKPLETFITNILASSIYTIIVSDNQKLDRNRMILGLEYRVSYIHEIMNTLYSNKASKLRAVVDKKINKKITKPQKRFKNFLYHKLECLAKRGISSYEAIIEDSLDWVTQEYIEELVQLLRMEFFIVDYTSQFDGKTTKYFLKISW